MPPLALFVESSEEASCKKGVNDIRLLAPSQVGPLANGADPSVGTSNHGQSEELRRTGTRAIRGESPWWRKGIWSSTSDLCPVGSSHSARPDACPATRDCQAGGERERLNS